jgi:hypothetical protein
MALDLAMENNDHTLLEHIFTETDIISRLSTNTNTRVGTWIKPRTWTKTKTKTRTWTRTKTGLQTGTRTLCN